MAVSVSESPTGPVAADAALAAEILTLRRLAPDLEPADSPAWLSPAYRVLAHRLVAACSTRDPV